MNNQETKKQIEELHILLAQYKNTLKGFEKEFNQIILNYREALEARKYQKIHQELS